MRRLALFAVLALGLPARGGEIVGYVANDPASIARFDRFPNGINSPTRNTSSQFVGAGLDLSGIGWRTDNPTFGVSLLAAVPRDGSGGPVGQYVVGANHVGGGVFSSSVTFADNQGVVRTFPLATNPDGSLQTRRLTTNGSPSDVIVARLAAPVAAADGIRPLPLADLTPTTAVGLDTLAYVQNAAYGANRRQLGLATIGAVQQVSFGGDSPTVGVVYRRDPNRSGSVLLTGGDSGGPLFARGNAGETALVGAHFGVDAAQGISVSSFLPHAEYVTQLNAFMQQDNLQVLLVPVPEPAGLLLVAAVGAAVWRRRAA